eukprot:180515_1
MMNYGHSVAATHVHHYGHNPVSNMNNMNDMNNYIGQKRSYHDLYITSANNTSCMNMINDTANSTNIPFYSQHNSNDNIYQSNDCSFSKRQRFDETQTYNQTYNPYTYDPCDNNQHIYRHTYDPCDNNQTYNNQNILNTMNPTTIYTHANNNNNNGILNNMLSFKCDNNNFCNDYGVN